MHRRSSGIILGGVATMALVTGMLQSPATASPPAADPASASKTGTVKTGTTQTDDRATPMQLRRAALATKAAELVLSGDRRVQSRGGSDSVRVGKGEWVEYGTQDTAQILSFLVQFGNQKDPAYADAPKGPKRNKIKKPGSSDNSTYWKKNFNRKHYKRMFFTGLPDQKGESFRDVYDEMSSGRFDVEGDVSPWVTVPKHEASYGTNESSKDMTRFIADSATAWVK